MDLNELALAAFVMALAANALVALPASACRDLSSRTPIIHSSRPPIPPKSIAAEIEITGENKSGQFPITAKIISMIQGSYSGTMLTINSEVIENCEVFPRIGQRGIVIGHLTSSSEESLVIEPILIRPAQPPLVARVISPKGHN